MRRWLARATGAPGTASFRRFETDAASATVHADRAASLSDAELAAAARSAAGGPLGAPAGRPSQRESRPASPELLALLREAAVRTIGQRPFDGQLATAAALMGGRAVELDTGEGKTLAGALAAAGFALSGRRVHVLSVNDYLAERDAVWMTPLFEVLGLTASWIGQRTEPVRRRENYSGDIVYAPVSEVGYDVLRDRFVTAGADAVRPVLDVAIVDEADAVMIDEAMSPLVLAGSSDDETGDAGGADLLVRGLDRGVHFAVDDDHATVSLTDAGLDLLERRLGGVNLYDEAHTPLLTRLNLALHAHVLVERNVDYLVDGDGIRLINAARGRVSHLQRWPDGLHAAVEAKERVAVSAPGTILDTVTVQDLLRRYTTLSGMSGTVLAVAEELTEFYELPAGRIGRRLPNRRVDLPEQVLPDAAARERAVIDAVRMRHESGQPVLVGTQSVAESERLAAVLAESGIEATVLNARNDAQEAAVIARAGETGALTISTQLSGRGTDIRLGGPDEAGRDAVVGAGGLSVIAVGRYPSQRLDAQLRGRSGRQGDPGETVSLVAATDELVQANLPAHLLERLRRGRAPADRRVRIVDQAQRIAEGVRRDRHRDTWDFSRAIARQRETVLAHRDEVRDGSLATAELERRAPGDVAALIAAVGADAAEPRVRDVVLWCLDEQWCDHLAHLSAVRDGIHLQSLAGVNPRDEFHRVALRSFAGFFDDAYARAVAVLADPESEDAALRRPSATWTYMIGDNPLGSPMDRAARRAGRWVRARVYRIE